MTAPDNGAKCHKVKFARFDVTLLGSSESSVRSLVFVTFCAHGGTLRCPGVCQGVTRREWLVECSRRLSYVVARNSGCRISVVRVVLLKVALEVLCVRHGATSPRAASDSEPG